MAKNGWKLSKVAITEYPVAFGQKREIVGVGQSDTANNDASPRAGSVRSVVLDADDLG